MGSRYISNKLLIANENMAVDIAQLVKNNFQITDEEVEYMKGLTFNQMEIDAINKRLMDVGNGAKMNAEVINVYIVAPLTDEEIKYTTDKESAEFFGYDEGVKLNGIWLLNGNIDDNGEFVATTRDDIYRYTVLTEDQIEGMKNQVAYGEYSNDAWGSFITGYTPIYTVDGNFVGLLGIDMSPDKYQSSAQSMIFVLIAAFIVISIGMFGLFLFFYFKYIKAKEGQLYFDFYSRMSHDMRTPMNGILGMAELSKDENDLDTLHRNFTMVLESGKYMLGLINDTLDVQKLDAGRLRLDPKIRNCDKLIGGLVAMINSDAKKKNIDFVLENRCKDTEGYCKVDELRLQQIFMNIASNAIKFTPQGGKITFVVEDLGSDGNISGLGLSIVKKLVELMKGKIEVSSKQGEGTTFTIWLDIEKVDSQTAIKEIGEIQDKENIDEKALKGKNILLCEDHKLNAEITQRLLEKYGCNVVLASNGKSGVEEFEKSKEGYFDAILMDIRMPIMDGLTATNKIRSLKRTDAKNVPIIAMTANAFDEDINYCFDAGMNKHLAKPINPKLMYEALLSFFN